MAVSYKKLWKLLIDKDMKKKDLCVAAGISHASMAKLGKNENVTTEASVEDGGSRPKSKALDIYLDVINLFIRLLQIFSKSDD